MIFKKYVRKAVSRIVKDFKQKELIPLKILFFIQATTIAVLYPYLTIHMRDLGISIEETAIMSAMIPVIGILMPPLAGMVADKIGNFKIILSISTLIGGMTALLLLVVPPAKIKSEFPKDVLLDFGCGGEFGRPVIQLADHYPCTRIPAMNATGEYDTKLETCGLACQAANQSSSPATFGDDATFDLILNARSYAVKVDTDNETRSTVYNVTSGIFAANYFGSITRLPNDLFFFPSRGEYRLRCVEMNRNEENPSNDFLLSSRIRRNSDGRHLCFIGGAEDGDFRHGYPDLPNVGPADGEFTDRTMTLHYGDENSATVSDFGNVTCYNPHEKRREGVTVSVYLNDRGNDAIELSQCESKCLMTTERKKVCSNQAEDIVQDANLTFWVYFAVRVLIGITGSTTYSMFEVAVIAILREQKADYGLQRIYASIGGMVASPLTGFLIDYASRGSSGNDYSPAFYLYAALKVVSSLLILLINLEFKQAAKSVISDFFKALRDPEVLSLLTSCFILGSAWGYIESFLFWFLEDLGSNRSLMGITVTVGGFAGIPLLIFSGPIVNKIGHANVIFIGFVFYAIRLLGYSLIYNPYHCLYFEAMESITSALAITAAITYAAKLSTTTTDGSIQGLVGGLYYGVGKGAGTLIGGYLMKSYGTRETFQIFAAFTITSGIIYFLINHCYIRNLPNRTNNEIREKDSKESKSKNKEKVSSEPEQKEEHKNEAYVPSEGEGEGEPRQRTNAKENHP